MNFRKVILAIAVIALFAGMASAQGTNLPTLTCSATSAATTIRANGVTERPGDLLLTCYNVPSIADNSVGSPAPRFNVTVDFGVNITSRVDTAAGNQLAVTTGVTASPSEIMLLIDDPGSASGPVAGYGSLAPQTICTAANAKADFTTETTNGNLNQAGLNCPATLLAGGTNNAYWVLNNAGVTAANVYQGAVFGTKVIFFNVPVPNSNNANIFNTFRVTNARVAAPAAGGQVTATVTAAPPTTAGGASMNLFSLVASAAPVVANSAVGLNATVTPVGGISSCASTSLLVTANSGNSPAAALLNFTEGFATAFKTRVLPLNGATANDAQGTGAGAAPQNKSAGVYGSTNQFASESGLVLGTVGTVANVGLADTGTRLRATFKNLDPNANYWVSLTNVQDYNNAVAAPAVIGGSTAAAYAQLLPLAGAQTQVFGTQGVGGTNVGINVAQLTPDANGNATAVWEVTNLTANLDTMTFAVYVTFNPSLKKPDTQNLANVSLDLAPTAATGVTSIPRFTTTGAASKFSNVVVCRTSLLFPFVTAAFGYNTGMSIANTASDPYGTTGASDGACALNFYGNVYAADGTSTGYTAPATAITTGPLATGKVYAQVASSLAGTGFQGYGIATCDFAFAHGFAYVLAPNGAAMGYLANVLNTGNSATPRGQTLLGETLGQ